MRFHVLHLSLTLSSILCGTAFAAPPGKGDLLPDAKVQTMEGKEVSLREALVGQPSVLIFYRGGWCPYCNTHLADLKTIKPGLKKRGYRILAVSPDRPEELNKTTKKHDLGYTLLSDSNMQAAKAMGLAFTVDEKTRKLYTTYGIDLVKASGEKHYKLPHPAVFIVDKEGRITFRHVNEDYKKRLSAEAVLKAAGNGV